MATLPKSAAQEAYRREIARYLDTVRVSKGWTLVKMGEAAGGMAHTTIGRALKGEHTIGFPALLSLAEVSGIEIPESLVGAARQAQQPTRPPVSETHGLLTELAERLEGKSPEEQAAILKELQALLAKAG